MSDLRCSPYPAGMNIVTAFLEAKNQMSLAPCSAAEAMSEAPAPVSEAPQSKVESPAKTPSVSLVSPPSEAETLQAVETNPLDFHFLAAFTGEDSKQNQGEKFEKIGFSAVDLEVKPAHGALKLNVLEFETKWSSQTVPASEENPEMIEVSGFDVSMNTVHLNISGEVGDGTVSFDQKFLEAHAGIGTVVGQNNEKTFKIGVGASIYSGELAYDNGEGNSFKVGLSVGLGAGLSVTSKDSDRDGLDEGCLGAEVGPVSFEVCRENTPAQQAWEKRLRETEDFGDRLLILGEWPSVVVDGLF